MSCIHWCSPFFMLAQMAQHVQHSCTANDSSANLQYGMSTSTIQVSCPAMHAIVCCVIWVLLIMRVGYK